MTSLFIFRRDLRLHDNTALNEALLNSSSVIPCFILDPRQTKSPYASKSALAFMKDSLQELDLELKTYKSHLHLFVGESEKVIEEILSKEKIKSIYFNLDYTPFSKKRDDSIQKLCEKHTVSLHTFDDAFLIPPGKLLKSDDTPYTVFTPFFKKASLVSIDKPAKIKKASFFKSKIDLAKSIDDLDQLIPYKTNHPIIKGGRENGLLLIERIKQLEDYNSERNFPAMGKTTYLSPHHKFGTVSIRETYQRVVSLFGKTHTLISELFWRDFFSHILFHFPYVLGKSFHKKYDALTWENDAQKFNAWKEGQTGFPIVDAGMRELNETGWMHNRVRMIVSSFLIKDLHIDWHKGEKYFAQQLLDYDPAVNNGSWQWAASTGCDAQPYFRIFNPWLQQKRFDVDCKYIKKWIPDLKAFTPKEIHNWEGSLLYPAPIIDHSKETAKTKSYYSSV